MIGNRIAGDCITILIELRKICQRQGVFSEFKYALSASSLNLMQVGTKIREADILERDHFPELFALLQNEIDAPALQGKVFL